MARATTNSLIDKYIKTPAPLFNACKEIVHLRSANARLKKELAEARFKIMQLEEIINDNYPHVAHQKKTP